MELVQLIQTTAIYVLIDLTKSEYDLYSSKPLVI